MIDTDKCEHILYDTMFNPIDVYNVAEELLAEVKRLTAMLEETNHHLDLMVGRFGIEALVEMVGDD